MFAACGGRTVVVTPRAPISPEQMAELWIDPGPEPRDLFWGVGGQKYAPPADAVYRITRRTTSASAFPTTSTSPDGTEWSAKIGPEAQTEVVMSRILWGLGYHQPPVYYLPSWKTDESKGEMRRESEARFRPKIAQSPSRNGVLALGRQPVQRHARAEGTVHGHADDEQHRSQGRQQQHLHAEGTAVRRPRAGSSSAISVRRIR